MRRRLFAFAATTALMVPLGLTVPLGAAQAAPSQTGLTARNVAVCPTPQYADTARCHAILHEFVDHNGKPKPAASTPSGYISSQLLSAYNLTTPAADYGLGQTIAIVDAYDDPNAKADLDYYRSNTGLGPISDCTVSASGFTTGSTRPCFAKVNQNGQQGSYPRGDTGWAQEISLDLDMASAICPNCNILLVEAASSSFTNLGTAVKTAGHFNSVVAISNSYGSTGDVSDGSYGSYYNQPGIAVTASTGDNGYGVGYPATSDYTIAVGGTSLNYSSSGVWTESAWSGAGSGCSTKQSKPQFQVDYGLTACGAQRGIADVSAVANPNTGVAVYDSYGRGSGWMQFGGTSASSPIIAAVYALAKGAGSTNWGTNPASTLYKGWKGLNDVTTGSNGSCGGTVLCTAAAYWDGPTGLGTPNGLGAFTGNATDASPYSSKPDFTIAVSPASATVTRRNVGAVHRHRDTDQRLLERCRSRMVEFPLRANGIVHR